jgi:hypothetical protein
MTDLWTWPKGLRRRDPTSPECQGAVQKAQAYRTTCGY